MNVKFARTPSDAPRRVAGWTLGLLLTFIVGTYARVPATGSAFTDALVPLLFAVLLLGSLYRPSERVVGVWSARLGLCLASINITCGPGLALQPRGVIVTAVILPVLLQLLALAHDLVEPRPPGDDTPTSGHWTVRDWLQQLGGLWNRRHPLRQLETPIKTQIVILSFRYAINTLKALQMELDDILNGDCFDGYVYVGRSLHPALKGQLNELHVLEPHGSNGYRIYTGYAPVVRQLQLELIQEIGRRGATMPGRVRSLR